MLLSRPWLRDAKVSHDWGSNIVTILGNGILKTIVVTKHLNNQTKSPKVPLSYDFQNRITNVEKDIVFATKVELLLIDTIVLPIIPLSKSSHEIISSAKTKPIDIDSSSTSQYEDFLKLIEQFILKHFTILQLVECQLMKH